MDTILFISIFLLAAATLAIRFWNRRPPPKEPDFLPETQNFDGLFAEQHAEEMKLFAQAEEERRVREERRRLLGRADEGDMTALDEAQAYGDISFYREILQALVDRAEGGDERLRSIGKHIVDSRQLRSSGEFAAMMIERWALEPDHLPFTGALHLAALSDEVAVFRRALEVALNFFREGRFPRISAEDFLATVESAWWLIRAEARNSGSGFFLKRLIVDVRRELAAAPRRSES
jgi:hypothetical protein